MTCLRIRHRRSAPARASSSQRVAGDPTVQRNGIHVQHVPIAASRKWSGAFGRVDDKRSARSRLALRWLSLPAYGQPAKYSSRNRVLIRWLIWRVDDSGTGYAAVPFWPFSRKPGRFAVRGARCQTCRVSALFIRTVDDCERSNGAATGNWAFRGSSADACRSSWTIRLFFPTNSTQPDFSAATTTGCSIAATSGFALG